MKGHYSDVWQAVATAMGDRIAIENIEGEQWSYSRFAAEAGALAAHLRTAGVGIGDTVALLLHNRPEFLITLFACLATGVTPAPLNYRLRSHEVAALLDDSAAGVLAYPTSLADVVTEALAQRPAAAAPRLIAIDDEGTVDAPGDRWADIMAHPAALPPAAPDGGELWVYTGGTTGAPKAAVWSGEELLDLQMYSIYAPTGLAVPTTIDEVVAVAQDPATPHVVTLPLAPLMHGTALFMSINTLVIGGTVLLTSDMRYDPDGALAFAIRGRATRLIVAGDAVAGPLADAAERAGATRPDTVTSIISSGMRFSPETKARLHRLGDIEIVDMLAATEAGPFAFRTTRGEADLPGLLRLLPNAVVLDEYRRPVTEVGARGILALKGTLPKGYHGDAAKTAATFPVIDGIRYVIPGDWVQLLDDGAVELLGRGSVVINTGGEKVYPAEVEEALLSHPAVTDAVVVGIPDPRFGEVVTAAVVAEGADAGALSAHVAAALAGYKKPRHIAIVPTLNRTPHGKVDLARIRDLVIGDRNGSVA